jgi:uncharacterized protein YecE (DUF72 family)
MDIRVGTSGYSFEDWRRVFYPIGLDKGKMLDYYVRYFLTVEINSTYYRIPHPAVMANIARKAPRGFDFMIKVPQSLTHHRQDIERDVTVFREAVKPIEDTGKLSGLLAQFPFSFKCSADGLDYIVACREALLPHRLYVEFRHSGWVNPYVLDRLRSEGVGYVSVDEPQLYGLLKPDLLATTDIGYVRLHGRNAAQWWDGGPRRYDYDYSEKELRTWLDRILQMHGRLKALYVYFNNCYDGQAVSSAQLFKRLLGQ